MNEREMREAVRAEYAVTASSKLVDQRLQQAYVRLREQPTVAPASRRRVQRFFRWAGTAAAACAAAFVLLIGVSAANPALAASIPGMESIVSFLKGKPATPDSIVREGAVDQFMQPVADTDKESQGLHITETYFDGSAMVLGVKLVLPQGAPEEYRILAPDFKLSFSADGQPVFPYYLTELGESFLPQLTRTSETEYVGAISIYDVLDSEVPAGKTRLSALPDSVEVTLGVRSLKAADPLHMIRVNDDDPYGYEMETWDLEVPAPFTCTVQKNEMLQKVYPVHETKNGCTLEQLLVTPAWTEIQVSAENQGEDGEAIVVIPYGSSGNQLESLYLNYVPFGAQRFCTLDEGETAVTVKFFKKSDIRTPIAEFTVPVEGGFFSGQHLKPWDLKDDEAEIVFDPPLPEQDPDAVWGGNRNTRQAVPGVPFSVEGKAAGLESGSLELTFDNIHYYDDWRQAGLADEEMNLREEISSGHASLEDYTFVLLDLTVAGHDAVCSGENLWIDNLADMTQVNDPQKIPYLGRCLIASSEVQYFSGHGNGFTDYYHFTLEPNETRTFQVGYLVETAALQEGRAVLYGISDDMTAPVEGTPLYEKLLTALTLPPRS